MSFTIITFINVIFSTIKGIITIKGKPIYAAITNALYYGFYTYVIILTTTEPTSTNKKALITFAANLICVFFVKQIEKMLEKDKLWQITAVFYTRNKLEIIEALLRNKIQFNYSEMGKHIQFIIYSEKQSDSLKINKIIKEYNGRYFVAENAGRL